MKKYLLASLLAASTPFALAADSLARNKENVVAFYELAFNQHKLEEAVAQYVAEPYIQHNPGVADGGKAFIDAFAPFLKEHPQSHADIKRVVAEDDLVVVHVHSQLTPDERGEAVIDIFRLDENGKSLNTGTSPTPCRKKRRAGIRCFEAS